MIAISLYPSKQRGRRTHGGIDGAVALEVAVFASAMVGLAEGYAGQAASDGT